MDFYRPTTKLQKVIFSVMSVSLFIVSPNRVPAYLQTYSNLFNLGLTIKDPPTDMFKLVHYVLRTSVSKRTVGIR